jgi:hypothetical protein
LDAIGKQKISNWVERCSLKTWGAWIWHKKLYYSFYTWKQELKHHVCLFMSLPSQEPQEQSMMHRNILQAQIGVTAEEAQVRKS